MSHLFFSSLVLKKDTATGDWQLAEVMTNKGRFVLGADTNENLSQELVDEFATYVRNQVTPEIMSFLEQEFEEQKEKDKEKKEQKEKDEDEE